jgi:hypothetical protein
MRYFSSYWRISAPAALLCDNARKGPVCLTVERELSAWWNYGNPALCFGLVADRSTILVAGPSPLLFNFSQWWAMAEAYVMLGSAPESVL